MALGAGFLLAGCSHGVVIHAHRGEASGEINARLVLVAPIELRWEEPSSLLAYLRTLDVEEALCRSGRLATLGPGEVASQSGEAAPG